MGATALFWGFSTASYPDLERSTPANVLVENSNGSLNGKVSTSSSVCIFCGIKEALDAFFLSSLFIYSFHL